jgi:glycosyltransferase involved in cell wall biosynthesis
MRIAVWHNLPSGGGKRALYDHLRGLSERGHEIEIWCPPTADREYLPLGVFGAEHVVPLDFPTAQRWRDAAQPGRRVRRALVAMDDHCRRCADQINVGGFDVLFANACQFFRTTSIGRFAAIPSTIYLGEPYRWLYEALPRFFWLAMPPGPSGMWYRPSYWNDRRRDADRIAGGRIQARAEFESAAGFDTILVNSLFSRESVLRAYGLDAEVCYLGTDSDRFVDLGLAREPFFVGLGGITPEKNVALAIRAVALLAEPRPPLVWIGNIVANPDFAAEMHALARDLRVEFRPLVRISDEEIITTLNRATAMIFAPRLEPFGLAPIEAAACGLPVVAVAEGGVRESVIHDVTGLHVPSDPAKIAAALTKLLIDPALARRLGASARSNVERQWTLKECTDRIEGKLASVAAITAKGGARHDPD